MFLGPITCISRSKFSISRPKLLLVQYVQAYWMGLFRQGMLKTFPDPLAALLLMLLIFIAMLLIFFIFFYNAKKKSFSFSIPNSILYAQIEPSIAQILILSTKVKRLVDPI